MTRWICPSLTLLFAAALLAADDKATQNNKKGDGAKSATVKIVQLDAKKGTLTVKWKDAAGKEIEKTFRLSRDVRMFDETGKVVAIDVFEAGDDALIVEREGRLSELRRPGRAHRGRPSDLINALIDMSDCDDGCAHEIQRAYDILRQLDKNQDGKIDADELKAARPRLIQERVDNLFKRLDKNKDGKISRDEARGLIKAHFDQIDKNKDGLIDRDELLQAATERHDAKRAAPQTERKQP